jgi:hypothetical protein
MALGPNSEIARNLGRDKKLFASLLSNLTPTRNKGRERKSGEVVAGKEPLTREVTVAVEIGLHHVVRFAKQFELSLSLPAKTLCLLVVFGCPRVIKNDFVLKFLLVPGTPIHGSPTLTGDLKLLSLPGAVRGRATQVYTMPHLQVHPSDHRGLPEPWSALSPCRVGFAIVVATDGNKLESWILTLKIENVAERALQIDLGLG